MDSLPLAAYSRFRLRQGYGGRNVSIRPGGAQRRRAAGNDKLVSSECIPLEIGFVRLGYVIVEDIVRIVLGADDFIMFLLRAPIMPHAGPGLIERVGVVYGED